MNTKTSFRLLCLTSVLLVYAGTVPAQTTSNAIASATNATSPSAAPALRAGEVIGQAIDQARTGHKKVMVIFHASWCHWCRRMDTLMNTGKLKDYFQDAFVVCHVDVQEQGANKYLENPGYATYLNEFGGDTDQGVPFWAILDEQGKALVNSRIKPNGPSAEPRGDNAGCPLSEKEVAYFIQCLQQTTSFSKTQLDEIAEKFKGGD